jgi:hypothetical protein
LPPEVEIMNGRLILALGTTALLVACRAEKTGPGTYEVQTPTQSQVTESAATAREQVKEGAKELAKETKPELQEAGEKLKTGAKKAEGATGTALEKAGKKLSDDAKKH